MSCLRALSRALNASSQLLPSGSASPRQSSLTTSDTNATLPLAHLLVSQQLPQSVLHQRCQSLLQALHTLAKRILPPIVPSSSSPTATTSSTSPLLNSSSSFPFFSTQAPGVSKLWLHWCRLLSSLASFSPQSFSGSWQLFLADSRQTELKLEESVNQITTVLLAGCKNEGKFISRISEDTVFTPATAFMPSSLPSFLSPVFSATLIGGGVGPCAVHCLYVCVKGLPLQKWFKVLN